MSEVKWWLTVETFHGIVKALSQVNQYKEIDYNIVPVICTIAAVPETTCCISYQCNMSALHSVSLWIYSWTTAVQWWVQDKCQDQDQDSEAQDRDQDQDSEAQDRDQNQDTEPADQDMSK